VVLEDEIDALDAGAVFSPCRRFRYLLWRRWDPELPVCAFIGLNPSTADELTDDPTVRRCINYAKGWGYGSLHMLNIFAWRDTDPAKMKLQGANAIGPRNNEYLMQVARGADMVIAAWGTHGAHLDRSRDVRKLFAGQVRLHLLKQTQNGEPGHPLYLRADLQPIAWLLRP
jgi:hypothetical protein